MIKSCWCDVNLFVEGTEGIRYLFSSSLPLNTKFTFFIPPTKPWIAWSVCSGIFHSVNSNNCFRMHWYLYQSLLRLSWRSFESRKSWKGLNFYNIITKRMMFPLDLTRSGRNWKRGGEFNFTPWPRRPRSFNQGQGCEGWGWKDVTISLHWSVPSRIHYRVIFVVQMIVCSENQFNYYYYMLRMTAVLRADWIGLSCGVAVILVAQGLTQC